MTTRSVSTTWPTYSARRRGFTLLEAVITAAVFTVGFFAMSSTSEVVTTLKRSASERALAQRGLQAIGQDLLRKARTSSADPALWAAEVLEAFGPDGDPGSQLHVPGLEPWPGLDHTATVTLVTDETSTNEDHGVDAGLPRDLDGDGQASRTDVSGNASLLPAIVRVRWSQPSGDFELHQVVYLIRP